MAVQRRAGAGGRQVRALVVGGLGALVLVGCAGQPGAAAVVDGTAVPVSDLRSAIDELGPYLNDVSATNVLTVLVHEPTIVEVAAEHGVGVSDEDAEALLDSVVTQQTPDADVTFSDASVAVARYSIALSKIQELPDADAVSQEVTERISALDVEVNPRFGTVEDGNTLVAPTTRPWIVVPQDGAAPDGTEPAPEPSPSAP